MGLMFDGIDLKANYNFVVTKIDGRGSPPVSYSTIDMPRVDGLIAVGNKLKARDLTISGYVYGSDAATKKDELIKLISQAYEQEKKLTFPDTNRSIYVKLAGEPIVIGPIGPVLNAQAYEITFRFTAQDPYFYGEDHDEVGFNIVKVNANAPTYLISPRRKFLKREPSISIYPYTIVNLLGRYGNFEVDSNGDGLADGWQKGANIDIYELNTDAIFGNYSQKVGSTVGSGSQVIYRQVVGWYYAQDGEKLMFSLYAKVLDGSESIYLGIFHANWSPYILKNVAGLSTSWQRVVKTFDITFDASIALIQCDYYSYTHLYDGVMLVNLSKMGYLPPPLKEYFSNQVSKWEDLATTSTITAIDGKSQTGNDWLNELLPYVDSVATLGYAWGA